ncbi:MAG TPA: hypothetical protein VNM66_04370 [Thermodesulfobacteriota bacterium]|nr:hypothetical protein [Thermodesulfobacteriota bacterium]
MTRLLLVLLLLVALPPLLRLLFPSLRRAAVDMSPRRGPKGEELVRDPACLTYVARSIAVPATIGGQVYLFCSEACAESYRRLKEA